MLAKSKLPSDAEQVKFTVVLVLASLVGVLKVVETALILGIKISNKNIIKPLFINYSKGSLFIYFLLIDLIYE